MRSKPTWKSKAKQLLNAATGASNGSKKDARPAKSNKPAEDHTRTPQPQLSEAEVEKLRAFLDKSDKPFGIVTEPVSKKRKRESSAPSTFLTQEDLWEDRLTVRYEVRPREKWESLRKYRKFTVGTESIATGQCILVKHDNETSEDQRIDIANQWKAKVLEVRALDQEHVYIRLAWLNRPEDLDKGRQPHHGKNELIPTNQLDIIDGMTVNGTVDVQHWKDDDDDSAMMAEDQYFWRQTYDYANTRTFSPLRKICIDNKPQNPDEMILQCSNESCRKWLHVKCIAEQAVQRSYNENVPRKKSAKDNHTPNEKPRHGAPKDVTISRFSLAQARAEKSGFVSEVYIKGLPAAPPVSGEGATTTGSTEQVNGAVAESEAEAARGGLLPTPPPQLQDSDASGPTPAESNQIVITMPDGSRHAEDLSCLFCGNAIED